MDFIKSYRNFIQAVFVIFMIAIIAWCGCVWAFYDNGITDYKESRDKAAVKSMFHDDWQLLYYGDFDKIHETDFNVDFMLDNRSSSQHVVRDNLILKVLREKGKTVGFLAYYARSPYWWHMLFLIVDKDSRGKGYASKLVQFFIDDSVARGAIKLTTFTRLMNARARAIYEGKFGFKDIGHPDDKYIDLLLYPSKKN